MEGEYTAEDVMLRLRQSPRYEIVLGEYERAWNPASTKKMVYGPAKLVYLSHPDGAVDLIVRDVDTDA